MRILDDSQEYRGMTMGNKLIQPHYIFKSMWKVVEPLGRGHWAVITLVPKVL